MSAASLRPIALLAALACLSAVSCASTPQAATAGTPHIAPAGPPRASILERTSHASAVSRVREIDYASDRVPPSLDGYRIVFVSDIHFRNRYSRARLNALFSEINAEKADCIILGGDLTLGNAEIPEFCEAAASLRATEGVYATLGNHDFFNGKATAIAQLRKSGIVVLDATTIVTPRGLNVAGIADFRDEFPAMGHFIETIPDSGFTVLASHNPDFMEKATADDLARFDLVLSGHLHGGQITLFGYAPILPSEYGQRYRTGTVWKGNVPVIVSNGAGYSGDHFRFRFCAPSDFLSITLRRPVPPKVP